MASQEHAVRAGNAARQPVAAELAEARQAQQGGLDGSPRCVAQREQLSAAFGRATLQRQVGIEGVDDADVEAKIVAIVKYCSPKAPYKALVSKHGEPQVLAAIRAMVTDPVPHGNFKLQQFGQPIAFLGKLSDYMEPKAAAQEPLLRNDVVEMPDGTVGVVLEVEGVVGDHGEAARAEDDLVRVMEPFVQIESVMSRRHQGAGLGLALVKSMTGLHGGRFLLDSVPGRGTTATIALPAVRILPA